MTIHISTEDLHEFFEAITSPTCATVYANVSANLQQVHLGHGARRVLTAPTGGRTSQSSVMSEALSVELLSRLLGSDLTKTETELMYASEGPMTDYACQIHNTQLGVSVTRAMSYWGNYTKEDAIKLLTRKLNGILRSSERIVNASFDKQILHVLTMSGRDAAMVKRACRQLSQELKSDTVILITTLNTESVFFDSNQSLAKKRNELK
ncbi:hypothetical protein BJV82DRAFT_575443 [Fennellomyces sp. T-0311]|nr:hypothetical protein BJV82DRAFT_575443 [Fennellomyces sp. T-0311]